MLGRILPLLLGMAVLLGYATPCAALGELSYQDGCYTLAASGSGRLTGAYLFFPKPATLSPAGDDGVVTSVMRLLSEASLGPKVDLEGNFFVELARFPPLSLGGTLATAGAFKSPYRYPHLSLEYWQDGAVSGQLGVDRFWGDIDLDAVTLSLGRMPINYGVTRIFVPNDFFAPFSPTAINTLYKPGVDAMRVSVAAGLLFAFEMVAVMGVDADAVPAWGQSAVIARVATVMAGFEWSALGGKLAERWLVGAALQGEVGPLGLFAEGHLGFPDREPLGRDDEAVHGRGAAGVEKVFSWQNAVLAAEYLYISDGASAPNHYLSRSTRLFADDIYYLGQHYLGLSAGGDVIPILRANILGLTNLGDGSGMAGLTVIYNVSDESDVSLGALFPFGKRSQEPTPIGATAFDIKSEFGALPSTVFLESRFYF